MAQMLAPYNNSMRLGQGFNSYTQQVCLDKAVFCNPSSERLRDQKPLVLGEGGSGSSKLLESVDSLDDNFQENLPPSTETEITGDRLQQPTVRDGSTEPRTVVVRPWSKPQIVTYSSRFVDKISDVTDAMNISGSLSIKTATIGGKANGQYVDSDKFKSSDINFHLQVRVTNQIHDAPEYKYFNKIDNIDQSKFAEVYGNCFISGWEEGGELNAVISVKVLDKSKIFQIKAGLEAELTTPSISGKVTASVDIKKENLNKETETTIAVNWSGGGSIKDPGLDWNIATLKQAAAAFPDFVAITPQRTFAILTKYTSLASFHAAQNNFSPLDYENAGIYTGALLDSFMDYKVLWKQISTATDELEANRATIQMSEIPEDMAELAIIKPVPTTDTDKELSALQPSSITDGNDDQQSKPKAPQEPIGFHDPTLHGKVDEWKFTRYPTFPPTFAGLIRAKKICRMEMAKIVKEVDVVAKDPAIATDARRDLFFLNPLVFKQLLPVVRSQSREDAERGVHDPQAQVLLGYSQPKIEEKAAVPVHDLSRGKDKIDFKDCDERLQQSIKKAAHKSRDYQMKGCVGPFSVKDHSPHSQASLFNDLEALDATFRPTQISIWADDKGVKGIEMQYANGVRKAYGDINAGSMKSLALRSEESEIFTEVLVREATDDKGNSYIVSMAVATSAYNTIDTATAPLVASASEVGAIKPPTIQTVVFTRPEDTRYSLRGFFGFQQGSVISTLGVVWGRDGFVPVPARPVQLSLARKYLDLPRDLQDSIRSCPRGFASDFLLGTSIATSHTTPGTYFNAVEYIDSGWRLRELSFATTGDALRGLRAVYANGRELIHGGWDGQHEAWKCQFTSDLAVVKITAGKKAGSANTWIDTVEFIRGEDAVESQLPAWPLNVSTIRFLGASETRVYDSTSELVESAPNSKFAAGYAKWSVRGFYGTYNSSAGMITRLGAVWGKG